MNTESNNNTETSKSSSKKRFLVALFICLLVLGSIFGFVYWYKQDDEKTRKPVVPGEPAQPRIYFNPSSFNPFTMTNSSE
ncbi:hypothetical protein A0H76_1448 [Hepatospora eriocheir]|uniref:Uncharacterized protein n=1 Tax=Hepatospora eriocheir TaxID=1081669 RepID=A0A1X0Q5T4_9MICR|nr:hypothetical protein A0H76_1448 [Hepatospora eriocheir]